LDDLDRGRCFHVINETNGLFAGKPQGAGKQCDQFGKNVIGGNGFSALLSGFAVNRSRPCVVYLRRIDQIPPSCGIRKISISGRAAALSGVRRPPASSPDGAVLRRNPGDAKQNPDCTRRASSGFNNVELSRSW